jgi:hypothetical protein
MGMCENCNIECEGRFCSDECKEDYYNSFREEGGGRR